MFGSVEETDERDLHGGVEMTNVFMDVHHDALRYSLQLLFEKRLGSNCYTPIGLEWFHEGYWAVYIGPGKEDTARQFLGLDHASNPPVSAHGEPLPPSAILNANYTFADGIYYVVDPVRDRPYAAITLEKFKSMKFDIIIASMPQHIGPFIELQRKYQPQAKLIFQIGNSWAIPGDIKNVLASCAPVSVPAGVNAVFYHQEFDLDTYKYEPPTGTKKIHSFIHYMKNKQAMNRLQELLGSEWSCRSFGAGMEDSLMKATAVADKMREGDFGFISKPEGDGFGHSVHGLFAVGRPPVVWGSHYRGKLAGQLMEHNRTCIDVEKMGSMEAVAARLKEIVSTDEHAAMCKAAADKFREVVDYDREEQEIRKFLERLQ